MFLSLRGNKIVQDSSSLQRRVWHPHVYPRTQTGNGVSSNLRQLCVVFFSFFYLFPRCRQIIYFTCSLKQRRSSASPWWEAAGNAEAPPLAHVFIGTDVFLHVTKVFLLIFYRRNWNVICQQQLVIGQVMSSIRKSIMVPTRKSALTDRLKLKMADNTIDVVVMVSN